MKVAYLGPEKTYSEKAARELFPNDELIALQPIRRVVQAVEKGKVDYGIVPLENFYNGEVRETLDVLTECSRTRIIRDRAFEIVHCLGALHGHGVIEHVLSRDQALEQCSKYLCENYPDAVTIATASTSEAVERVAKEKKLNAGAIADESALKSFGLEVLACNLCPNNRTRFIVLGREYTEPSGNDKTFLVFHPQSRDRPGTLQSHLGFFSSLGINLEYIQSRPDGKGSYYFYIELKGHEKDEPVKIALDGLRYSLDPQGKHKKVLKVLGSYPDIDWKNGK